MHLHIKNFVIFKDLVRIFKDTQFITFIIYNDKIILQSILLNVINIEIKPEIINILNYENDKISVSTKFFMKILKMFKKGFFLKYENENLLFESDSQRYNFTATMKTLSYLDVNLNPLENVILFFTVNTKNLFILQNFQRTQYFMRGNQIIVYQQLNGQQECILKHENLYSGNEITNQIENDGIKVDFESNNEKINELTNYNVDNCQNLNDFENFVENDNHEENNNLAALDFNCDNNWFFQVYHLKKHVKEFIFVFTENVFQITIEFPDNLGVKIVVQVAPLMEGYH